MLFIAVIISYLLFHLPDIQGNLTKVVDLTWDFSNETIYWFEMSSFHYTKIMANYSNNYWYANKDFCAGEHGGTHLDAPYHFYREGWKVAEIPIDRLIANGAYLDLSDSTPPQLLPEHLVKWVQANGQFPDNTVLMVDFGRSHFWPNRTLYMGLDADGNMHFPGVSAEAANWIARCGKIVGVGVGVASVDPGSSTDYMAHRILCQAQIYIIENVKMLEKLPAKGFTVVALPMKLKDGTGGPLRLLAVPKGSF